MVPMTHSWMGRDSTPRQRSRITEVESADVEDDDVGNTLLPSLKPICSIVPFGPASGQAPPLDIQRLKP